MAASSATSKSYGITEQKKDELDDLTIRVQNAQFIVGQCQAIVDSLSLKVTNLQGLLSTANADLSQAHNNKISIDQIVQYALDLKSNSAIAFTSINDANSKSVALAEGVNSVITKLIYTAERLAKFSTAIIRKKALNPLISDALVSQVSTAGKDANNAVALTLIALRSAFMALASGDESKANISLENDQSGALYQLLTAESADALQKLLHSAYDQAESDNKILEKALEIETKDLNTAQLNLYTAQVTLQPLQSGLTAANAAALAS
jgi:hypothetical protein